MHFGEVWQQNMVSRKGKEPCVPGQDVRKSHENTSISDEMDMITGDKEPQASTWCLRSKSDQTTADMP